jgi:TP901 family phage tail tape measure protein
MAVKIPIVSVFDSKGLRQAQREFGNLKNNLMAATKVIAGVGLAVGGMAAISVKKFGDFDAAMTQSTAIMGNLTAEMRKQMSDTARVIAKETTFSADQAAQAYFFLASAGLDAASSVAALPQVAKFAQAGMFDLAQATDLLTDAQSALGMAIKGDPIKNLAEMTRLSDVLVKANTLANASVEQFSTALTTKAGAALKIVNKDVTEGVAVLAALADQGIKGANAGTQLGIILRDLTTKAIRNKGAFKALGVEVFDSAGNMNNLGEIVGDIENALAGMSDETQKATLLQMGFSDKSLSSLQALLGTSDAIKNYEKELRSASGFTDDVAGKQLETFNAQLSLLKSAFEDVAIEVGQKLTPYLQQLIPIIKEQLPIAADRIMAALDTIDWQKFIDGIAGSIGWLVENGGKLLEVARNIAIFVGILWTLDTVIKAVAVAQAIWNAALLANPFTWVILGIAGIATGMVILKDRLDKTTEATRNYRKEVEKAFPKDDPASYAFNQAGINANIYKGILGEVGAKTKSELEPHKTNINQIENAWEKAKGALEKYAATKVPEVPGGMTETSWGALVNVFGGSKAPGVDPDAFGSAMTSGAASAAKKAAVTGLPALIAQSQQNAKVLKKEVKLQGKGLSAEVAAWVTSSSTPVKAANQALARISKNGEKAIKNLTKNFNNSSAGQAAASAAAAEASRFAAQAAQEAARAAEEAARQEAAALAERQRIYASFVDSVTSLFANLKNSITGAFNLPQLGGSTSAIIRNMKKLMDATRTFSSNISRLSGMGLNPELLQQVISAGPLAGARLASALVAGGSGAIAEISRGFQDFTGLAGDIAMTGVQSRFDTPTQQNIYNISVDGGVGSGATIGQAIVEAIKAYERTSGAVWQGA